MMTSVPASLQEQEPIVQPAQVADAERTPGPPPAVLGWIVPVLEPGELRGSAPDHPVPDLQGPSGAAILPGQFDAAAICHPALSDPPDRHMRSSSPATCNETTLRTRTSPGQPVPAGDPRRGRMPHRR